MKLSRRALPPLRALTAFEAAARLGSFRMAADELGITRSAVSHQIKALEDGLGIALFSREARKPELTSAGLSYYPVVRDAFDQIEAQTVALRPQSSDEELTVQVYVTVALKWLIPKLHDFERRFPDMRIRLSTAYFDWDFDEGNVDAAFILARNRGDHYYNTMYRSLLTPVCSPEFLRGPNAIRSPEDLRKHKLLYVYTAEEDWRIWLGAAGVKGIELSDRLAFDSYILAQEAAIEGRGIAMTIGPFAVDEIRSGRLVQPFSLMVPHRHSWVFCCEASHRLKPKIRRFESWLIEQVAADRDLDPYRLENSERTGT